MIEYKVGDIIEGTITTIRDFGAMMIFSDETRGLLHISQVANTFIRNIHKYLKVGKTYQVKIIGIEEDGFLKVSMSQITEEEKEEYHNSLTKKYPVDEERIDFTALKEKLPEWLENEKEQEND